MRRHTSSPQTCRSTGAWGQSGDDGGLDSGGGIVSVVVFGGRCVGFLSRSRCVIIGQVIVLEHVLDLISGPCSLAGCRLDELGSDARVCGSTRVLDDVPDMKLVHCVGLAGQRGCAVEDSMDIVETH